ncbi:ZapG family protein [Marinicellulosiphila megalodicopiae]|uniref:ZapG family protein n=1 Tax=Marinicellulosiphila megalodicopiae TaxID=2724896 RepID=UPI003BB1E7EC
MFINIGLIILGIGTGILIYHFFLMNKHGGKSLSKQLAELKKDHQQYQYDVSEHFSQTTEMLETLNEQYAKVQLHIQSGAELLVKTEKISVDQIGDNSDDTDLLEIPIDYEATESVKPKDYV